VDLVIVNGVARGFDGLRFAAQLRSDEQTRQAPILAVLDPDDRPRMVKALDIGVNDVLSRPVDPQELSARARTQIKRKRYTDYLRNNLDQSLELAVTDQLTGLHNRRYMAGQLGALVSRAAKGGEPVAALMVDIDHFKRINDSYGHDVGDEVLQDFALRLATNVRAIDLACRFGGESSWWSCPTPAWRPPRAWPSGCATTWRVRPSAWPRAGAAERHRVGGRRGDPGRRHARQPCSSGRTPRSTKPRLRGGTWW
jgi:CheY-like chemotaxis protein